jgi:hypothetical protein
MKILELGFCRQLIAESRSPRAAVAQLVERVLGKDEVISSSLISSFARRGGTALLAMARQDLVVTRF